MPLPIDRLVSTIDASRTVLFFGSGSSIPSGAPQGCSMLISELG